MWGRYVESELDKAKDAVAAKDHKNIQRVLDNKLKAILHPLVKSSSGEEEAPRPVAKGQFRDPMQFLAGKQGSSK